MRCRVALLLLGSLALGCAGPDAMDEHVELDASTQVAASETLPPALHLDDLVRLEIDIPPAPDAGSQPTPDDVDDASLKDAFTLAVLPDTQHYAESFPAIFERQAEWLSTTADSLRLALTIHLGDVVNRSYEREQWLVAERALGLLQGQVPFLIVPGNHDYGDQLSTENAGNRQTLLHEYFPRSGFERMPSFGGFYPDGQRVDSSYHVVSAGGEDWLIIGLEFGPRDEVLEWADGVLRDHPDHRALIVTHAYLYNDGSRYDWQTHGRRQNWNPHKYPFAALDESVNDGQEIWDELISWHPNVVAVLCGHVHSEGVAHAATSNGDRVVHEMLSNYQHEASGGLGFLRLLTVQPALRRVTVNTYSPWVDRFRRGAGESFSFDY